MTKKGDTLVEVLLAVGIFSMIAISVVAVMSGGTSEAQLALETTLTRQEIDAQAEALRYIHDSYISDKNSENTELVTVSLWEKIIENAIVFNSDTSSDEEKKIVMYAPTDSCPNIAKDTDSTISKHAFILNTRQLRFKDAAAYIPALPSDGTTSIFKPADTYPRLRFVEDNKDLVTQEASSINNNNDNTLPESTRLNQVDGLYIIAVADNNTTLVLDIDGKKVQTGDPAFYDFYIRSCWYGTDTDVPSTISTVIRLHNPKIETSFPPFNYNIVIDNDTEVVIGGAQSGEKVRFLDFSTIKLEDRPAEAHIGWCTVEPIDNICGGTFYKKNAVFSSPTNTLNPYYFYPVWRSKFWVDVNVFIDGDDSTSGHDEITFQAYEDGELVQCDSGGNEKCPPGSSKRYLKDYYRMIADETPLKTVFKKEINGYQLYNMNQICNDAKSVKTNCTVTEDGDDVIVTLIVDSNSHSEEIDSSGHYSIQIEPRYKKI